MSTPAAPTFSHAAAIMGELRRIYAEPTTEPVGEVLDAVEVLLTQHGLDMDGWVYTPPLPSHSLTYTDARGTTMALSAVNQQNATDWLGNLGVIDRAVLRALCAAVVAGLDAQEDPSG